MASLHLPAGTRTTLAAHLAIAVLAAGLLCGCQGGKPGVAAGAAPNGSAPSAPGSGDASAEEVAAAARGELDCPARIATPVDAAAPVDDVVGVRPGMRYEEAANVVMCSHPLLVVTPQSGRGFDIQTYGQTVRQGFDARFAEPRVQKSSREIMREMQAASMARGMNAVRHDMKPGQAKWFVGTIGLPGQERVISVAREEWFDAGRNPTVENVTQALTAKYGTPTSRRDQEGSRELRWGYDPRGRPITETSPLYNRCDGSADPDGPVRPSADCGVVVAASIRTLHDNPALSQFLQVGTVDQAGAYAAVNATEQGLQAADARHRAEQVQDASKNAQGPQL